MAVWLLTLFVRFSVAKYSLQRRAAGQGLVEYALVLVFIAIVVVGILAAMGDTTCDMWYEKIYRRLHLGTSPDPLTGTAQCPT